MLEKEKVPVPRLVNENETVVEHCRDRNADRLRFGVMNRMVRAERTNTMVNKLGSQLQ